MTRRTWIQATLGLLALTPVRRGLPNQPSLTSLWRVGVLPRAGASYFQRVSDAAWIDWTTIHTWRVYNTEPGAFVLDAVIWWAASDARRSVGFLLYRPDGTPALTAAEQSAALTVARTWIGGVWA